MKILAIRGENLASLAGAFEVDLETSVLGGVGLFAITGATGAGKSTLLDAVCLALFDAAPRLDDQARGVMVGNRDEDEKVRLASDDPRSLVRRGAVQGSAEVDFAGVNNRRYRATWSARRGHGHAHRPFLQQEMQLVDLESQQPLGRTRTEVKAEIERALGLSYAQFRRSALLAQGDFAAFLRAKADDRGSLLEQMTGTELYTAISMKAHERYGDTKLALITMKLEVGAVHVLAADERDGLGKRIDTLKKLRKAATETRKLVEGAVQWFDTRTGLASSQLKSMEDLTAAKTAREAMASLREELTGVLAAHKLAPALDAARKATDALDRARKSETQTAKEANTAYKLREASVVDLGLKTQSLTEAESALSTAKPALDEAMRLDQALIDDSERLKQARSEEATATKALASAKGQVTTLAGKLEAAVALGAGLDHWLAENDHTAPLLEAWPPCRPEVERHGRARLERAKADEDRPRLEAARDEALRIHETSRATMNAATSAFQAAESSWDTANKAAQGAALTAEVREARDALTLRTQRLEKLPPLLVVGDTTENVDRVRDSFSTERWYDVHPRYLYVEYRSPIGVFRVGQQGSYWGMGLLANDGDHPTLFGEYQRGSLVERVLVPAA